VRKSRKIEGTKKIALIILVTLLALGLILPSFMSLIWGLGY
jgi:cytochrome c oxidase subunit IV